MRRRRFLQAAGGSSALALAGCLVQDEGTTSTDTTVEDTTSSESGTSTTSETTSETTTEAEELSGTVTVATYESFLNAPSESYDAPGAFVCAVPNGDDTIELLE